METTKSRKLAALFFFVCAMILGLSMYQIASSDPSAHAWSQDSAATAPTAALVARSTVEPISMKVDQAVVIGRSKIVFRGLADGQVHFDHYLLDYNPHYAFKYEVPVDVAREGFKIGTRALKVTYVGGGWVHFKFVAPGKGAIG